MDRSPAAGALSAANSNWRTTYICMHACVRACVHLFMLACMYSALSHANSDLRLRDIDRSTATRHPYSAAHLPQRGAAQVHGYRPVYHFYILCYLHFILYYLHCIHIIYEMRFTDTGPWAAPRAPRRNTSSAQAGGRAARPAEGRPLRRPLAESRRAGGGGR